jgi:SAM-dependent methyltransferase
MEVYNNIAKSFASTRISIWDKVKDFLDQAESNSSLLDVGCGGGQNMLYRNDLQTIGIDICPEFIELCHEKKLNVIEGNILNIPFPNDNFDSVICIAVIHHLKTHDERMKAIKELLRVTKKRLLFSLWKEMRYSPHTTKGVITKLEGDGDYLIPWRLNGETFLRFYHFITDIEVEDIKKLIPNIKIINSYGNLFFSLDKIEF